MQTLLETPAQPAHASMVERNSEFIADVCHVDSLDEAMDFVQSVRDMHPKARHVAFAAVIGSEHGQLSERMSDDGEPSGTAGKPILDVIRANNLTDTVVCVTRYFGGILLGSGGLIRAYASSAALGIKAATVASIVQCDVVQTTITYAQLGKMEKLVVSYESVIESRDFSDVIRLTISVPTHVMERFEHEVTEQFQGTVALKKVGNMNRI